MPSIEVRSHVETLARVLRLPSDASNSLDAAIGSASFSERLPEFHGRLAQARRMFAALPDGKRDKVASFLARKTVSAYLPNDPITRVEAHAIADLITAFNEKGVMVRELRPQIENLVCLSVEFGREKSVDRLIELLGEDFKNSPKLAKARTGNDIGDFILGALKISDYADLCLQDKRQIRVGLQTFRQTPGFSAQCEQLFYTVLQNGDDCLQTLARLEILAGKNLLHKGKTLSMAHQLLNDELERFDPASATTESFAPAARNIILWGSILNANPFLGGILLEKTEQRHEAKCHAIIVTALRLGAPVETADSLQSLVGDVTKLGAPEYLDLAKSYLLSKAREDGYYVQGCLKRAMGLFPPEAREKIIADAKFQSGVDYALAQHASNALALTSAIANLGAEEHAEKRAEMTVRLLNSVRAFYATSRVLRSPGEAGFGGHCEPDGQVSMVRFFSRHERPAPAENEPSTPSEFSSDKYPDGIAEDPVLDPNLYLRNRIAALYAWENAARQALAKQTNTDLTQTGDTITTLAYQMLRYHRLIVEAQGTPRETYARIVMSDLLLQPEARNVFFHFPAPALSALAASYKYMQKLEMKPS